VDSLILRFRVRTLPRRIMAIPLSSERTLHIVSSDTRNAAAFSFFDIITPQDSEAVIELVEARENGKSSLISTTSARELLESPTTQPPSPTAILHNDSSYTVQTSQFSGILEAAFGIGTMFNMVLHGFVSNYQWDYRIEETSESFLFFYYRTTRHVSFTATATFACDASILGAVGSGVTAYLVLRCVPWATILTSVVEAAKWSWMTWWWGVKKVAVDLPYAVGQEVEKLSSAVALPKRRCLLD